MPANYEGNLENLKLDKFTPEERRKITSKGGKKSAQARRRKKNIIEVVKSMIDSEIPASMEKARKNLKAFGIEDEDMTYSAAITAAMIQKAIGGNVKAAEFIRDTGGFKAEDRLKSKVFEHEKKMDMIKLGQENVQKSDASDLIKALESVEVE